MKSGKKLSILLFLIPVVLLLGGAGYAFLGLKVQEGQRQISEVYQPSLRALDQLSADIQIQMAGLKQSVMNGAPRKTLTFKLYNVQESAVNAETIKANSDLSPKNDVIFTAKDDYDLLTKEADKLANITARIRELTLADTEKSEKSVAIIDTVFETEAVPAAKAIQNAILNLKNFRKPQIEETRKNIEQFTLYQYAALLVAALASIILALMAAAGIPQAIRQPMEDLTARLNPQKLLPADDPLTGTVATYINARHTELFVIKKSLEQLARGEGQPEIDEHKIDVATLTNLLAIRKLVHQHQDEARRLQIELLDYKNQYVALENQTKEANRQIQAHLQTILQPFAYFETSPTGQIEAANLRFQQLTGLSLNDLKKQKFYTLKSNLSKEPLSKEVSEALQKGEPWQGDVSITDIYDKTLHLHFNALPLKTKDGLVEKLVFLGVDVSAYRDAEGRAVEELDLAQNQVEGLETEIRALQTELTQAQELLANTIKETDYLRTSHEAQKLLEQRLIHQQAAIQELTRNANLQAGNVREALSAVTETVVYALDDERVGLWLFAENGEWLRCLDLYERTAMQHPQLPDIESKTVAAFVEAIQDKTALAIENVKSNPITAELFENYLKPQRISAILAAQIHLGGQVVGFLMVENNDRSREWKMDEQNFVLSVADIVSLALEQGNRRAMEEELRLTLEEAQALEEELRQNAEEIEASNEEMRRTQIELRGQINALNNAAIVSETNLQGRIIYANTEFINTYKFTKKEILGINHNCVRSEHHTPEFFRQMWETIEKGQVWRGEVKNKAKDGSYYWISLTITPVLDLQGKPYKYISVGFDITANQLQEEQIKAALEVALEQEEQLRNSAQEMAAKNAELTGAQIELAGQLRALNNSALVYETDMDGRITYVNDELLKLTGYDRNDLLGKHYTALRSDAQPEVVSQKQWATVLSGKIWRGELEKRAQDGRAFWVMETNTPVLDEYNEPIKTINVLFDINEQKQQEFRLKKQQQALAELNNNLAVKEGNVKESFPLIVKSGLETLNVDRVSIWMHVENRSKVRCHTVLQNDENHAHAIGTTIDRELYPTYFNILDDERVIAAADAVNDPRTKELAFTFLKPSGVSSVLDASVKMGGKTVAIISFEVKGQIREWTLDEQNFAVSLADAISMVMEQKERHLTTKLKQAYAQLEEANRETARQKAELEETNHWLKESIRYAKRIQSNILPGKDLLNEYLENHFIVYRPRDIVGGDFYFFGVRGPKRVIIVADGTGHGVPGAFLTMIGYLLLNQIVNQMGITKPSEILYELHKGVRATLKQDEEESTSRDGMDIAVVTFDADTYTAEYAGANLPFYYYQDWEVHEVKPDKRSIGGEQLEEERIFTNNEIRLKPGDAIYLFTDGFVDQMGGPDDKRFSTRRFRDLILRTQHESMATQRALLNLEWKDWKEDREQLDDVTVWGVKF